jgi:hypothetical protein
MHGKLVDYTMDATKASNTVPIDFRAFNGHFGATVASALALTHSGPYHPPPTAKFMTMTNRNSKPQQGAIQHR